MKDQTFKANERLFKQVNELKKNIRKDIHSKCRNLDQSSPSSAPSMTIKQGPVLVSDKRKPW